MKTVRCILVAALLFSCGCYTTGTVSKKDLKARADPVDITFFTKDSLEYSFSKENYRVQGDTLSGYGMRSRNAVRDVVFNASVSLADIDSIETSEFDATTTVLLCGGIGLAGAGIIALLLRHDQSYGVVVAYPAVTPAP